MWLAAGCGPKSSPAPEPGTDTLAIAPDVASRLEQFARIELDANTAALSAEDRSTLTHLIAAAQVIDEIFRLQQGPHVEATSTALAASQSPLAEPARSYFRIMQGPWDRLAGDEPFVGSTPKPAGVGFYPEDLTKDELEAWITAHPDEEAALRSDFTVIRRDDSRLVAVPYSQAYAEQLAQAAAHLRAAAASTTNTSLRHFLETRAAAFESNDYVESDIAWMDLDATIEPTIGPYENYEDGLMGYGTPSAEMIAAIERLSDLPVDLDLVFPALGAG